MELRIARKTPSANISQPIKLPKQVKPTASSKQPSLPKPRLVSSKANSVTVKSEIKPDPIPLDLEQEDSDEYSELPIEIQEQLRQEKERVTNIHNSIDGLSPTLSLSENVDQNNLDDDEINSIMQEREAAMKRAKTSERKIKKT